MIGSKAWLGWTVLLLAVSAGGGHGGPVASAYTGPNWVLGHWRAADPSCSLTEEVYTPTEYRKMVKGEDSWHHPYRVVYNVSAQGLDARRRRLLIQDHPSGREPHPRGFRQQLRYLRSGPLSELTAITAALFL